MKIAVASSFPLDSNYASAINVVKIADGFASLGNEVTLFCRSPLDKNFSKKEFIKRYSLNINIKIKCYPIFKLLFLIDDHYLFPILSLQDIKKYNPDFVYARHYVLPFLTSFLKINTAAESHAYIGNKSFALRIMIIGLKKFNKFKSLITISELLRENFIKKGVPSRKVKVLSDTVDLKIFNLPRNYIKKPNSKFTLLYSGHLYSYKGIDTIIQAAKILTSFNFLILGGHDKDIEKLKKKINQANLKNVSVLGRVDFSKVPNFLFSADALLLPPSNFHPSAKWTSPVKMGEYLASKTPVICSDIYALKKFLSEKEVFFFKADNVSSLALTIKYVKSNKKEAQRKAQNGFLKAQEMSYEKKCMEILKSLNYKNK